MTTPYCVVCKIEIPGKRARTRTVTCSVIHNRQHRKYRLKSPSAPDCLYCVVCTAEIPEVRARKGNSPTCSNKCRDEYQAFRYSIVKKCVTCKRPCTPEDLESWSAWRHSNGTLAGYTAPKPRAGNPHYPQRIAALEGRVGPLEEALQMAISALEGENGIPSTLLVDRLKAVLHPKQKPVDGQVAA